MQRQTHNDVAKEGPGQEGDGEGGGDEPRTHRKEFPEKVGPRPCLVEGCSGQMVTRTATRVHFWHRHIRENVAILEEGNLPHPRFPLCNMMVTWQSLNGSHKCTAQCKKGAQRKRQPLAAGEERATASQAFSAYGRTL